MTGLTALHISAGQHGPTLLPALAQRLPGLQELALVGVTEDQFLELSRLAALSRLSRLAGATSPNAPSIESTTLLPLLHGGTLSQLAVRIPGSHWLPPAQEALPLAALSGLECLELALADIQVGAATCTCVPERSSSVPCHGHGPMRKCLSAGPLHHHAAPQVAPAAAVACLSRLTELSLDVQLLMKHVRCRATAVPAAAAAAALCAFPWSMWDAMLLQCLRQCLSRRLLLSSYPLWFPSPLTHAHPPTLASG